MEHMLHMVFNLEGVLETVTTSLTYQEIWIIWKKNLVGISSLARFGEHRLLLKMNRFQFHWCDIYSFRNSVTKEKAKINPAKYKSDMESIFNGQQTADVISTKGLVKASVRLKHLRPLNVQAYIIYGGFEWIYSTNCTY